MKSAFCGLLLFAATTCFAQQSDEFRPRIVVTESKTISVNELQQRHQSKARGIFVDAKLAAQKGDHLRAITLFSKVTRKDPSFSDARNDLAVEFMIMGQADRAIEELKLAVRFDPRFLMGFNNLAVILCGQKRFEEAENVAQRALGIDPYSAKASLLLAIALHGQGVRPAETQSALEVAARSNPMAAKLLKIWFGPTEMAAAIEPK